MDWKRDIDNISRDLFGRKLGLIVMYMSSQLVSDAKDDNDNKNDNNNLSTLVFNHNRY